MPELPEVERAVKLLQEVATGRRIARIETFEDSIVYSGVTHGEFATELTGRLVLDAKRYGKVFYLTLDGKGRHPVLHFGMTGMLQVKGRTPTYYKEAPKKASNDWPPRFCKFVLSLVNDSTPEPGTAEVAFLDPRRLGRVRLCNSPLQEHPISDLGFDPILSMPSIDTFAASVIKRSCPIKALLLDQSFSAGVGNWIADEVLYHARIHPEQRCNTLTTDQVQQLHHNVGYVCQTAVSANADDSLFPDHWLFKHRWGKGKKRKSDDALLLPSGEVATIKWSTVGGRTSAYIPELQRLPSEQSKEKSASVDDGQHGSESDLSPVAESDSELASLKTSKKRKAPRKSQRKMHAELEGGKPEAKRLRRRGC